MLEGEAKILGLLETNLTIINNHEKRINDQLEIIQGQQKLISTAITQITTISTQVDKLINMMTKDANSRLSVLQ